MPEQTTEPLVDLKRLCCSTICFRTFSFEDALQATKALGIEWIEIGSLMDFCPHFDFYHASEEEESDFIDQVAESGLKVFGFTTFLGHPNSGDADLPAMIAAGERNVQLAKKLNAKGIVFSCGRFRRRDQYPLEQDIELLAQFLRPMADACAAAGMQAMVESPHKGSLLRSAEEAAMIWDLVGRERLAPILDVNHYEAIGWGPAKAIEFIGADRIAIAQMRDGIGRDNRHVLGTGQIDFAEMFRSLRDGGYNGLYSFEFSNTTETLEGNIEALRQSIEYLKTLR